MSSPTADRNLLFGILALYRGFIHPGLSFGAILLTVDGGLLAVMLASLLVREPFTLQYAREQVEPSHWTAPSFRRANYVVAGVWAAALAFMTAADVAATLTAKISLTSAVAAGLVALVGALAFTIRYPDISRRSEPTQ